MKHLSLFSCLMCIMSHGFSQCRPVFVKQAQQFPTSSRYITSQYGQNYHQAIYVGIGTSQVSHHLWDDSVWTSLPATDFTSGIPNILKWKNRLIGFSMFNKGFDSTRADSNKMFVFLEFRNNRWDTLRGGVFDSADAVHIKGAMANQHGLYYYTTISPRKDVLYQYDSAAQKFVQKAVFEYSGYPPTLIPGVNRLLITRVNKINGRPTHTFAYIDGDSVKVNMDSSFNITSQIYPSMLFGIDPINDHIYMVQVSADPVMREYSDTLVRTWPTKLNFDQSKMGYFAIANVLDGKVIWTMYYNNNWIFNVLCDGDSIWKASTYSYLEFNAPITTPSGIYIVNRTLKKSFVLANGSVLQGRAYIDLDSNCSFNSSLDFPLEDHLVSARSMPNDYVTSAYTDSAGNFEIFVARDSFILSGPGEFSSCVTDTMVVSTDTAMKDVIQQRPDFYDLKAGFNSGFSARWNGNTLYTAVLENKGERGDSAHFEIRMDPRLKIISVDSQVNYFNDSVARGVIRNLGYYEKRHIRIVAWIDSGTTKPDTIVCHELSAFLFNAEKDSSDNRDNKCQRVVYSLDPNHKDCDHEFIPVSKATRLEYFIEFENEGNDDAFDVTVVDMLSGKLDTRTLTVLGSSHPYTMSLEEQSLSFAFKDIHLKPKSQDPVLSKGFIRFSIMCRPGLANLDSITNKAYIYFDLNKPVITNTSVVRVSNQISSVDVPAVLPEMLQAYPNPLNRLLTILSSTGEEIWIYDVNGRLVQKVVPLNGKAEIDVSAWPAGLYFLRSGHTGIKLVKLE